MAGLICLALGAQGVTASEIVRWVDADGITQFTDPQYATSPASVVAVQQANGMVVPTSVGSHNGNGRPSFTRISKAPKKNKRGWRGYQARRGRNSR
jgi:hypothetical protein